jgi:hypothetical protein
MSLESVLERIHRAAARAGRAPTDVKLVVVSKGRNPDEIRALYTRGIRDFGENRVQEAEEKRRFLPPDIRWHFIGNLQANKVRKVVGHFACIHSISSLELALKASALGIAQDVLLEVNIAQEASKHGMSEEELLRDFSRFAALPNIRIRGLMTMAPLFRRQDTVEIESVRSTFRRARALRDRLNLSELSMGMSQDFELAIEEGATIVRIGSAVFS